MLDIYFIEDCKKLWELYGKVHNATIKLERWCRDTYHVQIRELLTDDEFKLIMSKMTFEGTCIADYTRYMYPDYGEKAKYELAYKNVRHLVKLSTDMLSTYVAALKRRKNKNN